MNLTNIRQRLIQRERIVSLINKGFSIPKISKEFGIAKSTIYYHYKKIKGRKFSLVKITDSDKVKGEFLGAFSGDGNFFFDKKIGHYTVSIHLNAENEKEYGIYLKNLIEKGFNKKVRMYSRPKKELLLVFYSKKIFELINEYLYIEGNKTLNVHLKKPIESLSADFLLYFIRGIIDTDGHVNRDNQIILALISKKLIAQVSTILKEFGIKNKITLRKTRPNEKELYQIKILKNDSRKYRKIIGFSNKYKEKNAPAEI